MNPLTWLWPFITDFSRDWGEAEPPTPEELTECAAERAEWCEIGIPHPSDFEVIDLTRQAASATYGPGGKLKRTRYRPNNLAELRVVIALHQAGVERTAERWRESAHRVTCCRAIGPTGDRFRVHPLATRLVSTNRFDRAPWACIPIEILGNFEGVDGTGNWYHPEKFGFGRANERQLEATRVEIADIVEAVYDIGGEVEAIAPHIVAGRGRNGKPNRQLCCGSRQWSEVGEWAGSEFGLAIPGPDFSIGGLVIPDTWHGRHFADCRRFL